MPRPRATEAPTIDLTAPPVVADGQLGATASETSVYEEPQWGARRLGYLRLRAVVPRAGEPKNKSAKCPGGWYRVLPRGYVCAGALATIDVGDPRVKAA